LDVVVRKSTAIFQLLAGEDQPLLVWRNAFLVLNFGLDILNGVRGLNLKSDGFASQGLDKNLHSTSETKDQMQSRFLLDVVIRESASIFQLLSSKDQPLLVWGNAFLVLNFGLDILDGVGWLHLQGDGLAGQSLHEDLHTSTQTQDQVES